MTENTIDKARKSWIKTKLKSLSDDFDNLSYEALHVELRLLAIKCKEQVRSRDSVIYETDNSNRNEIVFLADD